MDKNLCCTVKPPPRNLSCAKISASQQVFATAIHPQPLSPLRTRGVQPMGYGVKKKKRLKEEENNTTTMTMIITMIITRRRSGG